MKMLFLIPFILLNTLLFGQLDQQTVNKIFLPEEDCHLAVFALDGNAMVYGWDEPTIKIIATTINTTENMIAAPYLRAVEMRFHEEERVMIFQPAPLFNYVKPVTDLRFEIYLPHHIRYQTINLVQPLLL